MKLLEKECSKEFWAEARDKECFKAHIERLKAIWAKNENTVLPALKYSDFKLYFTTGDRKTYENYYFDRRHRLENSLMLSLLYPEEEKYLNYLMDMIYAICDEYTWCLPAHQKELEPNNIGRVDLFASETGYALAEIYTVMGDRLEPLIKNRIKYEIDRRIVASYCASDDYGWWEHGTNNWTAVCTNSVANTLMLMRPELVDDKMIARFNRSMDCFLSGFKNDGICTEGCGYWGYGFGFYTMYADSLRKFTDGKYNLFEGEKIKNIATFHQNMFLSGDAGVSFADGGPTLKYIIPLMHYLKNEYPSDIVVHSAKYGNFAYDKTCWSLRNFTWFNEDYYTEEETQKTDSEFYAADSQWLVKRTANYGFAIKGGNNAESHNHNDVGSFIFAKNGRQTVCDLGGGLYTRFYFNGAYRYKMIECGSHGHNLPIINGVTQKAGPKYAAKDTKFENGVFSTDIADAYGYDELTSVKRTVTFTNEEVKIKDVIEIEGKADITERLISKIKPDTSENGKIVLEDTVVYYDKDKYVCDYDMEKTSKNVDCYKINIKGLHGEKEFEYTIR